MNESLGLSPGNFTEAYGEKLNKSVKRKRDYQGTRTFKKRRLFLKEQRRGSQASQEVREGDTYLSCVDLGEAQPDVETIPPPGFAPQYSVVGIPDDHVAVYFDLETTGLG